MSQIVYGSLRDSIHNITIFTKAKEEGNTSPPAIVLAAEPMYNHQ